MTKTEIVEKIQEEIADYIWANEVEAYIKGYLDALCSAYEITWDERIDIEQMVNNPDEVEN